MGGSKARLVSLAVAAVLTAPSLDKAAQAAGISRRTLGRWLKDERFQRRLQRAETELERVTFSRLASTAAKAIAVRERHLDGDDAASLRAAATLLSHMLKAAELRSIAGRLDALERTAGEEESAYA